MVSPLEALPLVSAIRLPGGTKTVATAPAVTSKPPGHHLKSTINPARARPFSSVDPRAWRSTGLVSMVPARSTECRRYRLRRGGRIRGLPKGSPRPPGDDHTTDEPAPPPAPSTPPPRPP